MLHSSTQRGEISYFRKRFIQPIIMGACLVFLGFTQAEGAIVVPTDGTWTKFQWFPTTPPSLPLPTLDQPYTFTIPSGYTAIFDITDFALTGDVFEVFDINGNFAPFTTSAVVSTGLIPDAATPDEGFSNPEWSSESLPIGPGTYSIGLNVIQQSTEVLNGGGFLRVTAAAVPEPSTAGWMLLSAGLVVFRRRRRAA